MKLDLQPYHQYLSISEKEGKRYIYDPIRKKDLVLQPEEIVRQTWIQFLTRSYDIRLASLGVEKKLMLGTVSRRYDLVYYQKGKPHILFEFKSYKLPITQEVSFQAASYNMELNVPFIVLSNGIDTYMYELSKAKNEIVSLSSFPPLSG